MGRTEYGLQMYSLRDITKDNLKDSLRQVAEMGYKYVEFAGLFNNMAAAHLAKGETRHAEAYYRKALEILQQCGNKMDEAVTYVNLAQLAYQQDEPAGKIQYELDRAMSIFNDSTVPRDGYYAHTALKCAPAFGFFDRQQDEELLKQRAKDFYENA